MAGTSDRDDLHRYLEALFAREHGAFIEIAHRARNKEEVGSMRRGAAGGIFVPGSEFARAAEEIERLSQRADVWVGVLPRRPDPDTGEIGGSKEFVSDARALWVDCDLRETPDSEARLARFQPRPHIVVRSGGGFHAYWLLREPLSQEWTPFANRRLAHALGADLAATDAARLLRPPGTRNLKYDPPRRVELAHLRDAPPNTAREIVGQLADPPGRRTRPRRPFVPTPHIASDPLRAIPPPEYVRSLTKTDISDAGGFVSCPLPGHDDPEPSCQVFADPARGWYCYGCQRGGSIYDFAAHLWGLHTAGRDFIALRRELERRFRPSSPPGTATQGRREPEPPSGPRRSATPADKGSPREGHAPTALLERSVPTQTAPPRAIGIAPPVAGPARVHELPLQTREAPGQIEGRTEAPALPTALLGLKAAALMALLLGGTGLFIVVFTLIPLSRPTTGEVVCGVSGEARASIPAGYLGIYRSAGRRFGLDWAVLAAIGFVESGHGHNMGPSSAGALGPMQFMPATWRLYGLDANRDGRRDVLDPADAIPGAARYLKAGGAPANWRQALFAYNHAGWYVELILREAERYRASCRELQPFVGGSGPLAWPLDGPVTSPFGMRWGRLHAGIDIAAPIGALVHAAERGRVALRSPASGYGNYLCLRHLPRLTTCYAHLSAYRVRSSEIVRRGQVIALVGCTGHCFGPHLHFEVRLGPPWSKPVDPRRYLTR